MRTHFSIVDPYTLAEIQEIIAAAGFTTIHYTGFADESVIKALKVSYSLSITDSHGTALTNWTRSSPFPLEGLPSW